MSTFRVGQHLRQMKEQQVTRKAQVLNEKKPLFADLGKLAQAITNGIRNAQAQGVKAKEVHVNPKMKEIMDTLAGYTIKTIGEFPIVANPKCPIENFMVLKA